MKYTTEDVLTILCLPWLVWLFLQVLKFAPTGTMVLP